MTSTTVWSFIGGLHAAIFDPSINCYIVDLKRTVLRNSNCFHLGPLPLPWRVWGNKSRIRTIRPSAWDRRKITSLCPYERWGNAEANPLPGWGYCAHWHGCATLHGVLCTSGLQKLWRQGLDLFVSWTFDKNSSPGFSKRALWVAR